MLSGNKGEWSELYVFLKLLAEGKLYAANDNLEKMQNLFYMLVKIVRMESTRNEYSFDRNVNVFINGDGFDTYSIQISEFQRYSNILLEKIRLGTGSFSVPEIDEFLQQIKVTKLKDSDKRKTDINIIVHDPTIQSNVELGFSIKSQLGGKSTLLNASGATKIRYKLNGGQITPSQISTVNSISTKNKITDRVLWLSSNGISACFDSFLSSKFYNNLLIIDSMLPTIIAEMLYISYAQRIKNIDQICEVLTSINPCNYPVSGNQHFYDYKIRKFLVEVAFGMQPATEWDGVYDATGGFIVVKHNGDIVCYHVYNRNHLENYLFYNTRFETPSTERHDIGYIYTNIESHYLDLSLQIRFLS